MQKTLKEKLAELKKENFSEEDFLNFFGSLDENEINLMLEKLSKESFSFINTEQKKFLEAYLKKLLEKIEEIKKQKTP